jgi:hypothetical protein
MELRRIPWGFYDFRTWAFNNFGFDIGLVELSSFARDIIEGF